MGDFQYGRLFFITAIRRGSGATTCREAVTRNGHVLSGSGSSVLCISSGYILKTSSCNVVSKNSNRTLISCRELSSSSRGTEMNDRSRTTCGRSWRCCAVAGLGKCEKGNFSWKASSGQSSGLNSYSSRFGGVVRNLWRSHDGDSPHQCKGANIFPRSACAWTDSSPDGGSALGICGESQVGSRLSGNVLSVTNSWSSGDCTSSCRRTYRALHCSTSSNSSRCSSMARDAGVSSAVLENKTILGGGVQTSSSRMPLNYVEGEALVPLGKLCAERNLCSRREAEFFAAVGLVSVNGKPLTMATETGIARGSKLNETRAWNGSAIRSSSSGSVRKFPVFFVRRNAHVQLMPRAQRVMDSRLTVLLHKPLHYLSCQTEQTGGNNKGRLLCRQLLTAERRWEAESDDQDWICFSSGSCSSSKRGSSKKPRVLNPGACSKMGCAGRLDSDSSGLVVFTQDGRIASQLVGGGAAALGKEYIVEVDLPISAAALDLLRSGDLTLDGRALLPTGVRLLPPYSPSVVCDITEAHHKRRFFGLTPSSCLSGDIPTALPQVPHGAVEGVLHLRGNEQALCVGTARESGEVAGSEDTDVYQHENHTFFAVESGRAREEQAIRLQRHPARVKNASLRNCFLRKAEKDASWTPSPAIHNDGASVISVPNEDMQEQQGGRESDALLAGKTTRMAIELFEGRHRQIRRMCELVGLRVLRLHRIRIGRIHLGTLPVGRWRLLLPHERFV